MFRTLVRRRSWNNFHGTPVRAAAIDTYGPTVRTLRQFLETVHALAAYVRDLMLPNPDKKSA